MLRETGQSPGYGDTTAGKTNTEHIRTNTNLHIYTFDLHAGKILLLIFGVYYLLKVNL